MPDLVSIIEKTDHARGNKTALVTLIEYGDFESKDCYDAFPIVRALLEEFGVNLRVIFRHFPQRYAHPHAELAAEAAEAAASQDRFWGMHDMLFSNQGDLHASSLLRYAYSLGLNIDRFARELVRRVHHQKVVRDMQSGWTNGVRNAPTFFVNGERQEGYFSYDSLRHAISDAISHDPEYRYTEAEGE